MAIIMIYQHISLPTILGGNEGNRQTQFPRFSRSNVFILD